MGRNRSTPARDTPVLDPDQIWVNPDCGLKTRTWDEVESALETMVAAAQTFRDGARRDPEAVGATAGQGR